MLSVAALFDVNEFVGWVPEDGDDATGIPIRIDERRPIDAIVALPLDSEHGRGFQDLDRFSFAISGEPCGEEISAVEQPCIAGFGREQDQLTNRDDASVVLGRPVLDVADLIGQPNAAAFHDPLARATLDRFSNPTGSRGVLPWTCSPSCSAACLPSSTTASTASSYTATSAGCRDQSGW